MPENDTAQARPLGDFARVDTTDAVNFVARLDEMHALHSFQSYKRTSFDLLQLRPGAVVADIGCGTGDDARNLSALVAPGGRVAGYDLSEAMLTQARVRHAGVADLTFHAARSDALGVPDASFDAVRADRVLIHVADPPKTLAEMVRITKSGGRIVISEPDMPGGWMVSNDHGIAGRVMREIAATCMSPYFPRELWHVFKDAGLVDVSLTISPVIAFDPLAVGKMLDVSGIVHSLVDKGELSEAEAVKWTADLAERGRTGRFVAGLSIVTAAGTKP